MLESELLELLLIIEREATECKAAESVWAEDGGNTGSVNNQVDQSQGLKCASFQGVPTFLSRCTSDWNPT